MSKEQNSELVLATKKLLKEKGYEVKTSHLYDVFAQLAGYKNWHVASAKNVQLTDSMKKYLIQNDESPSIDGYLDHIRDSFITLDNKEENFSLFDTSLPAWNYAISGDVGTGKSFILRKMLYSFVKQYENPLIYIIEDGGDRKNDNFVKQNNGLIVRFDESLPCINIFGLERLKSYPTAVKLNKIVQKLLKEYNNKKTEEELIIILKDYYERVAGSENKELVQRELFPEYISSSHFDFNHTFNLKVGECRPNKSQLSFISYIIDLMLKNNNKYEIETIDALILELYEITSERENRLPQMSDLISLARSKGFSEESLTNLNKWSREGEFPMFDTETNIDLSKNILLVDFKALESRPQLKEMYNEIFHHILIHRMYFTKGCRKLIVRDDINYNDETNLLYLIDDLRTSRKNGIITITVSKAPLFYEKVIASHMQVSLLCKNASAKIQEEISNHYGLNAQEFLELKNLGIKQNYSQFMMIKGREKKIYKNILSTKELEIYSK